MVKEEEDLHQFSCISCNKRNFKFSLKLLKEVSEIFVKCPYCDNEMQISWDSEANGVSFEKRSYPSYGTRHTPTAPKGQGEQHGNDNN